MTIYTVPVIMDLYDGTQVPISQGYAAAYPTAELTDAADKLLVTQTPVTVNFYPSGLPYFNLIATDSTGITPTGWKWQFQFGGQSLPSMEQHTVVAGASNLPFTATSASPAVFTAAGSAYAAGQPVALYGTGLPAGFTAGVIYYVVSPAGTSFQLAATAGGPAIASTSAGAGTVVAAQYYSSLS